MRLRGPGLAGGNWAGSLLGEADEPEPPPGAGEPRGTDHHTGDHDVVAQHRAGRGAPEHCDQDPECEGKVAGAQREGPEDPGPGRRGCWSVAVMVVLLFGDGHPHTP